MLCTQCQFDLAQLPASLPIDQEATVHGRQICCPLCGQPNNFRPGDHGVFLRDVGGVPCICVWDLGRGPRVQLHPEGLTLGIANPRALRPEEVVPGSVLSFRQADGTLLLPDLAIDPAYLDCVDMERTRRNLPCVQRKDARTVSLTLYLRGVPGAPRVVDRPILSNPSDATKDATFEHLNVRLWPPPMPRRTQYIFGLSDAEAGAATRSGRLRVAAVSGGKAHYAASLQDGGHVLSGSVSNGLPNWILVQYHQGEQLVGASAFALLEPNTSAKGTTTFGIDFGTSNTCVAYLVGGHGEPSQLPIVQERSFSHYVVHGGAERTTLDGTAFWPRPQGFGAKSGAVGADLLATELWIGSDRTKFARRLMAPDELILGVDYGLAPVGVALSKEGDRAVRAASVTGFKWASTTPTELNVFALQRLYLRAVLEWSLVRTVLGEPEATPPATVQVRYCMPLGYKAREELHQAVDEAVKDVSNGTGFPWSTNRPSLDEGRAAARIDPHESDMTVIADMGGGTTDIAVLFHPVDMGKRYELMFNTSIRYAGETLLSAYQSVIVQEDTAGLRRAIRETPNIRDLFGNQELFGGALTQTRDVRTRDFYGYVIDYIARLIASSVIEGRSVVEGKFVSPLRVSVYPLGNGWSMLGTLGNDPLPAVQIEVERRVRALLAATPEAHTTQDENGLRASEVDIKISASGPHDLGYPHAKAAVAYGILKHDHTSGEDGAATLYPLSILGIDTKSGRSTDPWFLTVGPPNVEQALPLRRQRADAARAAAATPPSSAERGGGLRTKPTDHIGYSAGQVITFLWDGSSEQGEVIGFDGTTIEVGIKDSMGASTVPANDIKVVQGLRAIPNSSPQVGSRVSYTSDGRTFIGVVTGFPAGMQPLATVDFNEVRVRIDPSAVKRADSFTSPAPVGAVVSSSASPAANWITTIPDGLSESTVFGWGRWTPELKGTLLQRSELLLTSAAQSSLQQKCHKNHLGDWYATSPYELLLEHVVGPGISRLK